MKKFILASTIVASLTQNAFAKDPCEDRTDVLQNSWMITLNTDDASSKDDVLHAIRLIGTGGFEVKNILNLGEDAPVMISFSYDATYYGDQRRAREVKSDVIGQLNDVEGIRLSCDTINTINPAIGVR